MIKKLLQYVKRTLTKPEGLKLDSVGPVSAYFGEDRGTAIDRYYIEEFLKSQSHLIRGTVLEVAGDKYSKKFGQNVLKYEVLHVDKKHTSATIIGDLALSQSLPSNIIDCFICTQTFNFIYNVSEAIKGAYQVLKPGGYLLATVSGISQISRYDMNHWGDYWRFTTLSAQKAFEEAFGVGNVKVDHYGNCLAAASFIRGLAAEEIMKGKLDVKHNNYQVTIIIVADKKSGLKQVFIHLLCLKNIF